MSDNHKTHELTVIVFTDIVGFTATMQKDEDRAMEMVNQVRDILSSTLPNFQGSLLKEIGDGNLLTFKSALNAVNCCLKIQNKIKEHDGLEIRIGIHLGDVIVKGEDVFGSGVNIASRIEQAASAGEICISRAINDQIQNKKHLKTSSLGMKEVKGIDEKIEVFRLSKKVEIHEEPKKIAQEKESISFMEDLLKRRVPQFIGVYVVASWTILQIVDWIVNRYILSPYLTDLSLGIIIAFIPTVLIMAYFHGKPGKDKWTRVEKIGIPVNLVVGIAILAIVFYPKDLGAATQTIIIENEEGKREKRIVPKSGFIKSVAFFPFKNNIANEDLGWISQGLSQGISCDLNQEIFIYSSEDRVEKKLKDKGFLNKGTAPISLKRSIAKDAFLEYFFDGSVELNDKNEFVVTSNLYTTEDGKLQISRTFINEDIFNLIDEISIQLRYDLGIPTGHIESSVDLPINEMLTNSLEAFQNFSKGISHNLLGEFGLGIPYLEKAIKIDNTFAMAYMVLQGAYVMTNQGSKRMAAIESCMEHMYKLPERYQYIPKLLYFSSNQDIDKQEQTLDMHLKLFPYDMQAREISTQIALSRGDYQKIIKEYKAILEIDQSRYNYLLKIGDIYNDWINDQESAMEYYNQYLEFFPSDYKVHMRLANVYKNLNNRDKSIESWENVLLFDIGNITASLEIADYNYEGKELIDKQYKILNSCKKTEDSISVYQDIESELEYIGMMEESIKIWNIYNTMRAGIQSFGTYAHYNLHIPAKLAEAGKTKEAFNLINEYEKIYQPPFDFQFLISKVFLYEALEDIHNLEKHMNELISKANEIGGEVILDMAIAGTGIEAELAILKKDYDKAINLIKNNRHKNEKKIQVILSKAYRLKNKASESKKIIDKILNEDKPYIKYEAAMVYYDLGQYDKAREYLNGFLDHYKHADATYKPVVDARETLRKWDAAGN